MHALAGRGARVGVCDLNAAGAEAVAAELGGGSLAVPMDVTDAASVRAGVASAVESLGAPDVLVNAAGWDKIMRFLDTDEAFWDRVIAINLRGVLATCHAVLPYMVERGSGAVVNVASEAGRAGSSGEVVYSAAKGAVIAFSKAVAREVARSGVRVNVVTPGLTDTPFLQRNVDEGHGKLMDAIVKATPLQPAVHARRGRRGDPLPRLGPGRVHDRGHPLRQRRPGDDVRAPSARLPPRAGRRCSGRGTGLSASRRSIARTP